MRTQSANPSSGAFAKRLALTVWGLSASFLIPTLLHAAEGIVRINFKKNAYEIGPAQASLVKIGAQKAKDNPSLLVFIHNKAGSSAKTSPAYTLGKVRSLKIFQGLVQEGVDPERIYIQADKAKASGDELTVEYGEGDIPSPPTLPTARAGKGGAPTFALPFAAKTAEVGRVDEASLLRFLSTVGKPGRETLIVEASVPKAGNKSAQQTLAELKALSAYEMLVRKGFPEDHLITKVQAAAGQTKSNTVTLRWTKVPSGLAKVLPATLKVEPPKTPPIAKPVPVPPPVKEAAQKPEPPQPTASLAAAMSDAEPEKTAAPAAESTAATASERSGDRPELLDIVIYAGSLMPGGDLKDHAKAGTTYGIGLGKSLWQTDAQELRINLLVSGKSILRSKESDLSGPLDMQHTDLRFDYALGGSIVRPFIGVGVGVYAWKASVTDTVSLLSHDAKGSDAGSIVTLGLDLILSPSLYLAPEVTWHKVGGDFAESLISPTLTLRWRL